MPVHSHRQHAPWCQHCLGHSRYRVSCMQLGAVHLCLSHAIAEVKRRTGAGQANALSTASEPGGMKHGPQTANKHTERARGAQP